MPASLQPDPPSPDDDLALMLRVAGGDSDAFRALVLRHQTPLLNFFARQGVSTSAEDLAQETFVRLWKYRAKYKPTAKFTTFLYTVAAHVARDDWRKRTRFDLFRSRYRLETPASSDGGLPRLRKDLDIQTALASLSPAHRETLVLAVCQGLPYEDVASILRIPVGTVKSRVFNALSTLEKQFRNEN